VDVGWSLFEGKLTLTWKETGGPKVVSPTTKGFGTKIITASLSDPRRGKVSFDWRPEGLVCTFELNMGSAQATVSVKAQPSPPQPQKRRRLLLVEDEILVGLFMREILEDLGFDVNEACRSLADGMALAKSEKFDGAILDMNLNGEVVYPLADLLAAQSVPFVFVTGYSADVVAERFAKMPTVQKPVAADALARILDRHLGKHEEQTAEPASSANDGNGLVAYAHAR
jgi:CheY-like chemotaxis protein